MSNPADPKPNLSVVRAEPATAPRSKWRRARTVVRWLATAALIGWLATTANWQAVGPAFAQASIPWLVFAAAIYVASQLASAVRWSLLVRAAGLVHSWTRLLSAYFEGMFVNVCLPTTVGGDVLKVVRVGGAQHKRLVTSTVVADRASGLAALLALLATGLLLKFDTTGYMAASVLAVAVVVSIVGGIWLRRYGVELIDPVAPGRESKLHRLIASYIPLDIRQLATRTPWPKVIGWAFVVQSLNVAMVAIAAASIGITVSPVEVLVAATTVSLMATLPISIAGIGVREASLPLLLAADGVPRDLAITLGIALSGIVLGVGLLGGPVHFLAQQKAARDTEVTTHPATAAGRRSA